MSSYEKQKATENWENISKFAKRNPNSVAFIYLDKNGNKSKPVFDIVSNMDDVGWLQVRDLVPKDFIPESVGYKFTDNRDDFAVTESNKFKINVKK